MPEVPLSQDPGPVQEAWNEAARADAIAEFGVLTVVQIDVLHGRGTAARWLRQQRVFSVPGPDGAQLPAFQFVQGKPRAMIAHTMRALDGQLTTWEILLWVTGSSGALDGQRPVDLLTASAKEVVVAAAYQASLSHD